MSNCQPNRAAGVGIPTDAGLLFSSGPQMSAEKLIAPLPDRMAKKSEAKK
jgi:hypothetical protein